MQPFFDKGKKTFVTEGTMHKCTKSEHADISTKICEMKKDVHKSFLRNKHWYMPFTFTWLIICKSYLVLHNLPLEMTCTRHGRDSKMSRKGHCANSLFKFQIYQLIEQQPQAIH